MYIIPMELKIHSIWYFHIHFHLATTIEVDETYENHEEMVPTIAIFDYNTLQIKF